MYFVSTIRVDKNNILRNGIRTIGIFNNYAEARNVILQNDSDLWEGSYYTYAIITFIEEDVLYPIQKVQTWFLKDKSKENKIIESIEVPIDFVDFRPYIIR